MYRAVDATTGSVLAERLRPAHTHWTRLKGLLGTRSLEPGEGLWIKPCRQVHMFGMRYGVDVAFLDDGHRVVRVVADLAPGTFSPRVSEATSILELPSGTLARLRVGEGAQITIDGEAEPSDESLVDLAITLAGNLVVAALFALFAAVHIANARRSGNWLTTMPIVVQEALLALLFMTRRRSIATSSQPMDWLVGVAGTFLPMLVRPRDEVSMLNWLGAPAQMIGMTLVVCGLAFLGRSIGIVAGNRGVKTAGLYRLVRHPMYGAYMLTYLGYVASYPTVRNCMLVAATIVALTIRAIVEERFLAQDPLYEAYLHRVRWRFIPYLY